MALIYPSFFTGPTEYSETEPGMENGHYVYSVGTRVDSIY